jgi:hypothetical protein
MKTSSLFSVSLLSAGLALSLSPARADDPSSPPVPPPAPADNTPPADSTPPADNTPPPAGHHRRMHPAFVLGELTEKLSLTPDQQKAVGAIIADTDGQLKALREDDTIANEDKRAKAQAIISAARGQIRAALTPAQQAIFDTLPTRGERGQHGGKPASPTPTPAS